MAMYLIFVSNELFCIAGLLFAWLPYALVALISAFGYQESITPMMGTIPALLAKSQVLWNPLIYVFANKNFRKRLPYLFTKDVEQGY
jgi:hypothetical protein